MSLFPKYQPVTHAKPAKPAKPEPTLATLATLAAPSVTEPSASSPSFQSVQKEDATQADMQRLVSESLAAVDREGHPWPARFVANMPTENRKRLRALERDIDAAVLNADKVTLPALLIEWRALLLQHLH